MLTNREEKINLVKDLYTYLRLPYAEIQKVLNEKFKSGMSNQDIGKISKYVETNLSICLKPLPEVLNIFGENNVILSEYGYDFRKKRFEIQFDFMPWDQHLGIIKKILNVHENAPLRMD